MMNTPDSIKLAEATEIFRELFATQVIKHNVGTTDEYMERRANCWLNMRGFINREDLDKLTDGE